MYSCKIKKYNRRNTGVLVSLGDIKMIKTYPSISRDPGLFFPGNGKRKKSGIPGNPGTGISREGTLNPMDSASRTMMKSSGLRTDP